MLPAVDINPAHGGVLFTTQLAPNNLVPDQLNWCQATPPKRAPCVWDGNNIFISARSYHTGGLNVCLGDGSVRFVTNQVSLPVWQAAGSRNGGEPGQSF